MLPLREGDIPLSLSIIHYLRVPLRRAAQVYFLPLLHHGCAPLTASEPVYQSFVGAQRVTPATRGNAAQPSRLSLFNRMVGVCRGAACYALRRKAHNESMQKEVLCFDTPSQLGTTCRLYDTRVRLFCLLGMTFDARIGNIGQ